MMPLSPIEQLKSVEQPTSAALSSSDTASGALYESGSGNENVRLSYRPELPSHDDNWATGYEETPIPPARPPTARRTTPLTEGDVTWVAGTAHDVLLQASRKLQHQIHASSKRTGDHLGHLSSRNSSRQLLMDRLLMEIEMTSRRDMARACVREWRHWPAGGLAEALACQRRDARSGAPSPCSLAASDGILRRPLLNCPLELPC